MFKSLIQQSPKSSLLAHQSKVLESLGLCLPAGPRLACELDAVFIRFHQQPLTDGSHLTRSSNLMKLLVFRPRQIPRSCFQNVAADVGCDTVSLSARLTCRSITTNPPLKRSAGVRPAAFCDPRYKAALILILFFLCLCGSTFVFHAETE